MDDGLLNLVKRVGTQEDAIQYSKIRDLARNLESISRMPYNAEIYGPSMMHTCGNMMVNHNEIEMFDETFRHYKLQLENSIRSLSGSGWGNLPDLGVISKKYFGNAPAVSDSDRKIDSRLMDLYFPSQDDIGKRIRVDGIASYVLRDPDGKVIVVRKNDFNLQLSSVEELASEDGSNGLMDKAKLGWGYRALSMFGMQDIFELHDYSSTGKVSLKAIVLSGKLHSYLNQIARIEK